MSFDFEEWEQEEINKKQSLRELDELEDLDYEIENQDLDDLYCQQKHL